MSGMTSPGFWALAAGAATVGSLHTVAPDHWVPVAALARARGWKAARTAGVTLLCGFGHVSVSALLGLLGAFFGLRLLQSFGGRMGVLASLLMVGFGVAYALWGLRRAVAPRLHGHPHAHYDHVHEPARFGVGTLFLLSSADPCVAVAPILLAAAPLGLARAIALAAIYEGATLLAMLALVLPARAGARALRAPWLERYADAAAGALIAAVGIAVLGLGW